jgi:hypothetical protein
MIRLIERSITVGAIQITPNKPDKGLPRPYIRTLSLYRTEYLGHRLPFHLNHIQGPGFSKISFDILHLFNVSACDSFQQLPGFFYSNTTFFQVAIKIMGYVDAKMYLL